MAAVEVDDAEAAHAERHAVAEVDALVVRTAVDHGAAHGADLVLEDGAPIPANDSGNATHETFSLFLVRLKPPAHEAPTVAASSQALRTTGMRMAAGSATQHGA